MKQLLKDKAVESVRSFASEFERYSWEESSEKIYSKTRIEVEEALHRAGRCSIDDFMALVSPAAEALLEDIAVCSQRLTLKRFGNTIQLYIPLYLSNECNNVCTYCGFSFLNKIPRRTLSPNDILKEIEVIKSFGYEHLLLVTGESARAVGLSYFLEVLDLLKPHFQLVSMEVQPLEQDEYAQLIRKGLNTVYLYQETYHRERYRDYHLKGRKTNFLYRLETPDRLGRAGIHKIGLGALIGLEDWRVDSCFLARHLSYLRTTYWRTKYSISFPRLRPAQGVAAPHFLMSDRELVQLIGAYRLFDENVELSLSTRESELFRDNAVRLGVTSMSAASRTAPGGYAEHVDDLEQFAVSDERSSEEVAAMIRKSGYEPVWKDWDSSLA